MPGPAGTRVPVNIQEQTVFIDESAFSFHCPRKYVWGPEGERASLPVAGIRFPLQTLLLAAHRDVIVAHKLQSDFAVQPPPGENYKGVNSVLFREFLQRVCISLLNRAADGGLPSSANRALFLQLDNAPIHKSALCRSLFNTLEQGRCFVIAARTDDVFVRAYGAATCGSLVVPPRIHCVFQPPYSPFLNMCEYVFAEIRRCTRLKELHSSAQFHDWLNEALGSPRAELPTQEQLHRWCEHCVRGRVRRACRDGDDITSNDFLSVKSLNPDIYTGSVRVVEQVLAWRQERRQAHQQRRAERRGTWLWRGMLPVPPRPTHPWPHACV